MNSIVLEKFCDKSDINTCVSELWWEKDINLEIRYISEFSSTKKIREFVDSVCKKYRISPRWRTRLVLIVDELNNNAIEYGTKAKEYNYFRLHLEITQTGTNILISVTDTGTGTHPKTAEEMEDIKKSFLNIDYKKHASIRGRGLFLIISHLVDSLEFLNKKDGWLEVRIQKHLEN